VADIVTTNASQLQTVDHVTVTRMGDRTVFEGRQDGPSFEDISGGPQWDIIHTLVLSDGSQTQAADEVNVADLLLVKDATQSQGADGGPIFEDRDQIIWQDRVGGPTWADRALLVLARNTNLVGADATQSQSVDALLLDTALVVANATQTQAASAVSLTYITPILVATASQFQAAEAVILTRNSSATIASATQAQAIDAAVLTRNSSLTIANTGTVTRANMRLSTVSGTAFVDFSSASILTANLTAKITLYDTAGKALVGYIKSIGTGEILDATNIVSSWTNGIGGEAYTSFDTSGSSITAAHNDDAAGSASGNSNATVTTVGKLYKMVAVIAISGGEAPVLSGTNGFPTTTLAAGTHTVYFTATGTSVALTVANTAGSEWNCTFVMKQVTVPAVTGVKITSTADGAVYDWASEGSGFLLNSATYTYAIEVQTSQAQAIGVVLLTRNTSITVANLTQAQAIGSVVFTSGVLLIVANGTQAQTADNADITVTSGVTVHDLVTQNATQTQGIDATILTRNISMITALAVQTQSADPVILPRGTTLTVTNATQSQTLDLITLTEGVSLAVASSTQVQSVDATVLVRSTNLSVTGATQAQTTAEISLLDQLGVGASTQVQIVDSVTLARYTTLSVNASTQAQAITAIDLTRFVSIVPDSTTQAQAADAISVERTASLVLFNAIQTQAADNVTGLLGVVGISVSASTQAQSAENVDLSNTLFATDSTQAHTADILSLNIVTSMFAQNGTQAQTIDGIGLTSLISLGVNNSNQVQTIEGISVDILRIITYSESGRHSRQPYNTLRNTHQPHNTMRSNHGS
jgi:hypothetical protein